MPPKKVTPKAKEPDTSGQEVFQEKEHQQFSLMINTIWPQLQKKIQECVESGSRNYKEEKQDPQGEKAGKTDEEKQEPRGGKAGKTDEEKKESRGGKAGKTDEEKKEPRGGKTGN